MAKPNTIRNPDTTLPPSVCGVSPAKPTVLINDTAHHTPSLKLPTVSVSIARRPIISP